MVFVVSFSVNFIYCTSPRCTALHLTSQRRRVIFRGGRTGCYCYYPGWFIFLGSRVSRAARLAAN